MNGAGRATLECTSLSCWILVSCENEDSLAGLAAGTRQKLTGCPPGIVKLLRICRSLAADVLFKLPTCQAYMMVDVKDAISSQCGCEECMPQTGRDILMTDADQQGV